MGVIMSFNFMGRGFRVSSLLARIAASPLRSGPPRVRRLIISTRRCNKIIIFLIYTFLSARFIVKRGSRGPSA